MTTKDAIKYFGCGKKLAEALGIAPEAVYQWGKSPPKLRQFELEELTGGKLKRAA